MARKPRIDYPGAWHHVMHRGARHAPIFEDDTHCRLFLDTLAETVALHGVEVHAYALMPNHYHLLVRSVHGTLSRAMRHLNAVYTQRLNRVHAWDGPLFRGRFKSQLVEDERYLLTVVSYIHLNPVRARLVLRPDAECWTSHRALVGLEAPAVCLTTSVVRQLAGGGAALHDLVGTFWTGSSPWPPDFELDTGWLHLEKEAAPTRHPVPSASPPPIDALLEALARITGVSVEALRTSQRGPRANPARRFAAVALATLPFVSFRNVVGALDMSLRQVQNLAHRAGLGDAPDHEFEWTVAWREHLAAISVPLR